MISVTVVWVMTGMSRRKSASAWIRRVAQTVRRDVEIDFRMVEFEISMIINSIYKENICSHSSHLSAYVLSASRARALAFNMPAMGMDGGEGESSSQPQASLSWARLKAVS